MSLARALASSLAPEAGDEIRSFLAPDDAAARWALVHGESLALLTQVPSESVDAVVTDGPYSSGGMFRGDRAQRTGNKYTRSDVDARRRADAADSGEDAWEDFEGDSRDQLSFVHWASLWSAECYRVAKPGAISGYWTDWRQVGATIAAFQAGGWVYRGLWVWDKTEAVRPMKGRPRNQVELVVWGSKGAMRTDRAGGVVEPGVVTDPSNIRTKRGHQTGKTDKCNRLWARLCDRGGVLLDPFAGSASMADSCLEEGRRYLGFEVVRGIWQKAHQRLSERSGVMVAPARRRRDGAPEQLTLGDVAPGGGPA